MSDNEYSIENWQTEAGVPNELNRFIRQDITGRSIENIESDDNDYRKGYQRLEEYYENKKNRLKKEIENDDGWGSDPKQDLKESEEENKILKKVNKRWVNPVTIKPAIKKVENFDFVNKFKGGGKKIKNANPPLPVDASKPPTPDELNDLLNYEEKIITKKKAIIAGKNEKKKENDEKKKKYYEELNNKFNTRQTKDYLSKKAKQIVFSNKDNKPEPIPIPIPTPPLTKQFKKEKTYY